MSGVIVLFIVCVLGDNRLMCCIGAELVSCVVAFVYCACCECVVCVVCVVWL